MKMEPRLLEGICTAALTPFTESMVPDEAVIERYCQFQVDSGVNGLFVNGSTAEFASMSMENQRAGIEMYVRHLAGRLPLVVHVGAARQEEAVAMARFVGDLQVDGLASVPPYFYEYDAESLIGYYSALSVAAPGKPLYVYNFPAAAINNVSPQILQQIQRKVPTLAGVKDTTQDFVQYLNYLDCMGSEFRVLMGSDAMVLAALSLGGHGAVSAAAASFPELMVDIYRSFSAQDVARARRLQFLAFRLRLLFGKVPIHARRKAALQLRGFEFSPVVPPGRSLTKAELESLQRQLQELETEFGYSLLRKV